MELPITQHMKFKIKDAVCGFLGFDKDDVDFCEDTLIVGYVSKLDEDEYPCEFRFFSAEDIEKAIENNKDGETVETYIVSCEYKGMATMATDNGIGIYPTYLLPPSKDEEDKREVRFYIQSASRG